MFLLAILLFGLEPRPVPFKTPRIPTRIYGGEAVGTCEWPFVVALDERCSGVLVAPEYVLTAAHCGENIEYAIFGETTERPSSRVRVTGCNALTGGEPGQGNDLMVCTLEAAQAVPTARLLDSTEVDVLKSGMPVALVGFGSTEVGPFGEKRVAWAQLGEENPRGELQIGGDGRDSCVGDSGGPALVELENGTWRAIGIASYGYECGGGGWYSQPRHHEDWINAQLDSELCSFEWKPAAASWGASCVPEALIDADPCEHPRQAAGCNLRGGGIGLPYFFLLLFAARFRRCGSARRGTIPTSALSGWQRQPKPAPRIQAPAPRNAANRMLTRSLLPR